MSGRDLGLQPKRKVDGFKAKPARRKSAPVDPHAEAVVVSESKPAPRRSNRRRTRRASTRRRVHTSIRLTTAEALHDRVESEHGTNTSVLIEALVAHPELEADVVELAGFEPRNVGERRTTVTFYLGAAEIDRLDALADANGYATRSAYVDAVLHEHLVAPTVGG